MVSHRGGTVRQRVSCRRMRPAAARTRPARTADVRGRDRRVDVAGFVVGGAERLVPLAAELR